MSELGRAIAPYIAEAYLHTWPTITITICWPHLSRQWTDGEQDSKITNSENAKPMYQELVHCHEARSPAQHQFLLDIVISFWSDTRDEPAFAKYFKRWYGERHWRNWHVNAALGHDGSTPNQQGIESGHKTIKVNVKQKELRNPTKRFLEFSMKHVRSPQENTPKRWARRFAATGRLMIRTFCWPRKN
jgi:hypothetical protein